MNPNIRKIGLCIKVGRGLGGRQVWDAGLLKKSEVHAISVTFLVNMFW